MKPSWTAPSRSPVPAFVSTMCICIAFVPMFALTGHCGLSVHAHGDERGVRHDRLLHPVADPGADPVALPAQAARPYRGRRQHDGAACSAASRWDSTASASSIATCWRWRWSIAGFSSSASWASVAVSLLLFPLPGRGLLPHRGFRPDHPACPHPAGRTHRGHQPDRGPDRAPGAPHHSRQPDRRHHRQYRPQPEPDQSALFQLRHHRPAGCRHLHQPEAGSRRPPPIMCAPCANSCRGCFRKPPSPTRRRTSPARS